MDVRELLRRLPHNQWRHVLQTCADNCYPLYARAAQIIKPRTVLELGAFQGLGLVSFFYGWPWIEEMIWIDNESYARNTNQHAYENVLFAARELRADPPAMRWADDLEKLRLRRPGLDLVHVDGDHSKAGCMRDLTLALAIGPRVVLVDDYSSGWPGVVEAVDLVAAMTGKAFFVWETLRRWAVFTDEDLPVELR